MYVTGTKRRIVCKVEFLSDSSIFYVDGYSALVQTDTASFQPEILTLNQATINVFVLQNQNLMLFAFSAAAVRKKELVGN